MNSLYSFIKLSLFYAALTALLIAVGFLIGGRGGAFMFFMISLIMNFGSYWFSDKIALSMSHAQPIQESEAPEIYADVRELTEKMGLPMPKVYMSSEMQPNAFATGRNPKHSAVCFTQGILQVLNRSELKGVLAHELGHIKHRDVLLSTVAAVFAGTISNIANMAMWFSFGSSDDDAPNPIFQIAMLILAPITATLIQLAISRSREYKADEAAAHYTGNPDALASALQKIHTYAHQVPMHVNPATASLWIAHPFAGAGIIMELFSTHPAMEKRIQRLMELKRG